ncbi:MAG: hypothetical protein A3E84_01195 [Gammaproteobacteria bacterium RIFCSPHIGHO2_12_FULL_42_13]|nr:MAG: hypothetical protein A3E84_01195 [Gammaproteobacteria bacterium RIFCSPHIGHO2_12_FULL_42_13]
MLDRFQVPDPASLIARLSHFRGEYDGLKARTGKTGSDTHKDWADLLQKLALALSNTTYPHTHEILLGACLYVSLSVQAEYYIRYNVSNSELFCLLKGPLEYKEAGKQPRDPKIDFICLMYFLEFISKNSYLLSEQQKHEQQKIAAIANQVKQTYLDKEIEGLLNRPTSETVLMKKFAEMPKAYQEMCKRDSALRQMLAYVWIGGHSSKRTETLKVLQALQSDTGVIPVMDLNPEQGMKYVIYYGFLVLEMMRIEKEYASGFRSPENSHLYRLCQEATNIRRTSDLQNDFLLQDMSILSAYVASVVRSKDQMRNWEAHGLKIDAVKHVRDDLIGQMAELSQINTGQIGDERRNNLVKRIGVGVFNTVTQLGVGFGVARLISSIIASKVGVGTLMSIAPFAPEFALVFLGLLWVQKTFRTKIVELVTAPVVPVVQSAVTTIAQLPLAPLARYAAGQAMFGPQEGEVLSAEDLLLLRMLKQAPDNVFPRKDKERLRLVFDLDIEERKLQAKIVQEAAKRESADCSTASPA